MEETTRTRIMCKFCGTVFALEDVSRPIGDGVFGFRYMDDLCPHCHRGFDDWYVNMRYRTTLYFRDILPRAIRYQRNKS